MVTLSELTMIFSLTIAACFMMTLLFLFLVSVIGITVYKNKKVTQELSLLKPIFIKLLQGKTGEIAAVMKVSNPVGDLMDMDVPMHKIEKVRREMVQSGEHEHLLWVSILVCAAYQDDAGYKEVIVDLMKKDLKSRGLSEDAEKLTPLCKHTFSPYSFFKIILFLLDKNIPHVGSDPLFKEIGKYFKNYNVTKALTVTGKFKVILTMIKYIVLAATAFVMSWLLFLFSYLLPDGVLLLVLLNIIITVGSTLFVLWNIMQKQVNPRSYEEIEADIISDIPAFRIRAT
jgi:hypothetical protein